MIHSQILFCSAFLWLSLSAFWLQTLGRASADGVTSGMARLRIWLVFALGEMAVAAIGHTLLAIVALTLITIAGCVEIARVSKHAPFAVMGVLLAALSAWMPPLHLGLALVAVSVFIFVLPFKAGPVSIRAGTLLLGFYIGLAPSALISCRDRPGLLMAVLLTLTTSHVVDIAAGFVGKRSISHRPLARLSPNKTVRGFLAGFVLAILAGLALVEPLESLTNKAMAGATPHWQVGMVLGFALWTITTLGDLVGSKVKRMLQIKDYGTLLGPHGGLLDRLDAFVPAVVAGCVVAA